MPTRISMGQHPLGHNGIVVSVPGVDVLQVNPADKTQLAMSTAWGQMANVIASGVCYQDTTVWLPSSASGFYPYILFHQLVGSGYDPHAISRNVNDQWNVSEIEGLSKWRLVHGGTYFYVTVNARNVPDPTTGAVFRYVAFNLPTYP